MNPQRRLWWRIRCCLGFYADYSCIPWVTRLRRERRYARAPDADTYYDHPNPRGWNARVTWWESYTERWHPTRLGAIGGALRSLVPFHLWGGYVFRHYYRLGVPEPWWYRWLRGDGE